MKRDLAAYLTVLAVCFLFLIAVSVHYRTIPVSAQSAFCDESIAISVAAAATQTIIAGLNGETVRVCALVITGDTIATTATFASAGTAVTGAMRICDECDVSIGNGTGVLFEGSFGGNLTIAAATGAVTGFIRLGRN